jgi:hypothetical protein
MVTQLQLLVAARCDVDDPRQPACAAQANFGKQVHEGVDALGRLQLAMRAAMPLLTAALAARFQFPMARRPTA